MLTKAQLLSRVMFLERNRFEAEVLALLDSVERSMRFLDKSTAVINKPDAYFSILDVLRQYYPSLLSPDPLDIKILEKMKGKNLVKEKTKKYLNRKRGEK